MTQHGTSTALEGAVTTNISVTRDGGILTVLVDRPPVNSLSFDMFDQLRTTFHRIREDESARVVLLRTAGEKAWVAGNDVTEFVDLTYDTATDGLARVRTAFNAVYDCPVPVIALMDGAAVGSGLCLASVCDVRIATRGTTIALPEINVGVLGGSKHAMRLLTQGTTRMMMYTGRRLDAERAWQLGFVDELVEDTAALTAAGAQLAEEIAAKAPPAIRLAKYGLNGVEDMALKPAYEFECTLTAQSRLDPVAGEAASAWLEKRTPSYADHRAAGATAGR